MKNKVLKSINYVAALLVIVSGSTIDSVSNIPFIVCSLSLAWLGLFLYANKERYCK